MSEKPRNQRIFEIDVPFQDPLRHAMFRLLKRPLERLLRLNRLNNLYSQFTPEFAENAPPFTDQALDLLDVWFDLSDIDLERIPAEGPVVVVGNHPFGAIEGILLASILRRRRDDYKIMANYLLARIPQMATMLISVDPFGRASSAARNIKPLKEALKWVADGHLLGVFPAGEVSHMTWKRRQVADPAWSESIGRLIRKTGAPVMPLYFDGANSTMFQLMGLVHRRLRTAMLPRELLNKRHKRIEVRVGRMIRPEKLDEFETDRDLIDYLRLRTYLLARRDPELQRPALVRRRRRRRSEILGYEVPIAEREDQRLISGDIAALPAEAKMAENDDYVVYHGQMTQMPHIVREIGRLRETTFRTVGEGTGKALDLDQFDEYYDHLFVWQKAKREIVGAYRLGKTNAIIPRLGIKGMYTRTLYKYKKSLIDQISPAIELGRSFVREEYQREFQPLHMLWRGIGEYVLRNPEYRRLFGPVSISAHYQSASRELMITFLKDNRYSSGLARLVKPKLPPKLKRRRGVHFTTRQVTSIDEISNLIGEIETSYQGVPVLLRHYLRLGGRLLGFNIDPQFNDALDGLILVDLLETDPRILSRYMGRAGADTFYRVHGTDLKTSLDQTAARRGVAQRSSDD